MELARHEIVIQEWEEVDCCPLCGGDGIDDYDKSIRYVQRIELDGRDEEYKTHIKLYRCLDCTAYYHNPRMTYDSMEKYYMSDIYRLGHPTTMEGEQSRAERTLELYDKLLGYKPKRFLDVGSSLGVMVREARNRYGCEAIGYDLYVNPNAVTDTVNNKDDVKGKYDLITCIHVLEHFHDPVEELKWMVSLLNHNGILWIEIPTDIIITIPHPIIYTSNSIHAMMKRIDGINYVYIEVTDGNLGHLCVKKK